MQAICILSIGNMRTRCNYDNPRNGYSKKTVQTAMEIEVPRDRSGSFEPLLIAKGQKRFEGFDEKIIATRTCRLCARMA